MDNEKLKEELCNKVREMCEIAGEEFLFIIDGKSCWSVKNNDHIRDVAYYHKRTENYKDLRS